MATDALARLALREEKISRVIRAARNLRDNTRYLPAEDPDMAEVWHKLDEALTGLDDHAAQSVVDETEGVRKQ